MSGRDKKWQIKAFLPDLITSFFLVWFFTLVVLIRQNTLVENEALDSNFKQSKLIFHNNDLDESPNIVNWSQKNDGKVELQFTFKRFKNNNVMKNFDEEHIKPLNQSIIEVKKAPISKSNQKLEHSMNGFDLLEPRAVFNKSLLETYGLYSIDCFKKSSTGGIGDFGKGFTMPKNLSSSAQHEFDEGWKKNYFNQYLSDQISINRSLRDYRAKWCKKDLKIVTNLPVASIVICFHNEAFSVLARTVYSVLNRSPQHLVKEIILVDDFSNMSHLREPLEEYFKPISKIKIVRASRREGLIRARLIGLTHVTAPVVIYLDSHCECTEGWLEPLLDRINRNSTTVVVPIIDEIDPKTFAFRSTVSNDFVGGFDWDLTFNWFSVSERERRRHVSIYEPIASPTMAGGLFAIDVDFFKKLGTYDPGFEIWGGENLELSFKIWMCGGSLEIVCCSHVGHIFRDNAPYTSGKPGENLMLKNNYRLAEVWLDEFAQYYYDRIGNEKVEFGDISDRKLLRDQLKCKSFRWYLDNIFPELYRPDLAVGRGAIINSATNLCLDSVASGEDMGVSLFGCHNQGKLMILLLKYSLRLPKCFSRR